MKNDREQKRAILGKHLPEFPGYSALDLGETDLQLRRYLAARLEEVRDRLAEFMAGADLSSFRNEFSETLRSVAALKDLFLLQSLESRAMRRLTDREEEQVFDLDLALLERLAALYTPLDRLEAAVDQSDLGEPLDLFQEGLREAAELFARRSAILFRLPDEKGEKI